jgi:hypothetical protein
LSMKKLHRGRKEKKRKTTLQDFCSCSWVLRKTLFCFAAACGWNHYVFGCCFSVAHGSQLGRKEKCWWGKKTVCGQFEGSVGRGKRKWRGGLCMCFLRFPRGWGLMGGGLCFRWGGWDEGWWLTGRVGAGKRGWRSVTGREKDF